MKASSKINTIKKNSDFQQVFEKGHSINGRYLVVYFLHNQFDGERFGFCVGRKLGPAVTRNRIKRRLREVVRGTDPFGKNGYPIEESGLRINNSSFDIILVARKPILTAQYQDIIKDYEHILLKTGILDQ